MIIFVLNINDLVFQCFRYSRIAQIKLVELDIVEL